MAFNITGYKRLYTDGGHKTNKCFYKTTDALSVVMAAEYFNNVAPDNLIAGDIIECAIDTDGNMHFITLKVASVTSGVVVVVGVSQELTASGAVTPGVMSVELNNSTTAVAATIASALAHPGMFVVKDTSTGGTETLTLTLTEGTFNGATGTVATLNAPLECLTVWFDSAGEGTIINNTGSVAIS